MCGGGGGAPKDNSLELERMRNQEYRRQQHHDNKVAKKAELDQAAAVEAANTGGRAAVEDYFRRNGADPSTPENQSAINSVLAVSRGVADKSVNPAGEYTDDPVGAWGSAASDLQTKAKNLLQHSMPKGFEYTKFADTADDPIISSIMAQDRINADKYLENLLKRGVITQGGYDAGVRDIERQASLAQGKLNTWGQQEITEGRNKATDISGRAYGSAAELNPGSEPFNAQSFATELDNAYNDFLQNLEVNIRGNISGNLFDTTGLADVAGGAQGGGNFKYDRNALSGIINTPEDDANEEELNRLQGSSGIF